MPLRNGFLLGNDSGTTAGGGSGRFRKETTREENALLPNAGMSAREDAMNDDRIREERERLRVRKEKDLQNGLVDRLHRESIEENWDLAESVCTEEELAADFARSRRLNFWLAIDFATFWLSVLFLTVRSNAEADPFSQDSPETDVLLIGLLFVSFFGWWVLLFLRRGHRQDFTRDFALRLEARKKAGRKTGPGEEDLP